MTEKIATPLVEESGAAAAAATNGKSLAFPANYPMVGGLLWQLRRSVWRGRHYFSSKANADDLYTALLHGGPMLVKLGQWLAQRPDVVGPVFAERLRHLQDAAPPHTWLHTASAVTRALGVQFTTESLIPDVFMSLDKQPMASGSIAQVHRGRMRRSKVREWQRRLGLPLLQQPDNDDDEGWIEVAVKVRHPDVVPQFAEGLGAMRALFTVGRWLYPVVFGVVNFDEIAAEMIEQCDLRREVGTMRRFAANFAGNRYVHVPAPLLWTEDVLIETFEEGVPLALVGASLATEAERSACRSECLRLMQATYLQMVLHDGFLHGDCHAGNVLFRVRMKEECETRQDREAMLRTEESAPSPYDVEMVLLDFGIASQLDQVHRTQHLRIMVGMFADQADLVVDGFRVLMKHRGIMTAATDFAEFERACTAAVHALHAERRNAVSTGRMPNVSRQMMVFLTLMFQYGIVIDSAVCRTMIGYALIEQGRLELDDDDLMERTLRWILLEDMGDHFPLMCYASHLTSAAVTRDQTTPIGVLPPVADPVRLRDEELHRSERLVAVQHVCTLTPDTMCGGERTPPYNKTGPRRRLVGGNHSGTSEETAAK